MRTFLALFAAAIIAVNTWAYHEMRQWPNVANRIEKSVVRLTYQVATIIDSVSGELIPSMASCTGIVINSHKGYVLTDNHCLEEDSGVRNLMVNRAEPVRLLYKHLNLDLAVISVNVRNQPAIYPEFHVRRGDSVAVLGYGYGLELLSFRSMDVMALKQRIPTRLIGDGSVGVEWTVLSQPLMNGMSGGPLFDRNGRMIGIMQRTDNQVGFALPIDVIYKETCQWWEYSAVKPCQ